MSQDRSMDPVTCALITHLKKKQQLQLAFKEWKERAKERKLFNHSLMVYSNQLYPRVNSIVHRSRGGEYSTEDMIGYVAHALGASDSFMFWNSRQVLKCHLETEIFQKQILKQAATYLVHKQAYEDEGSDVGEDEDTD